MQQFIALIVLLILSPILILGAIIVMITSGFPAFFIQERIGYQKKSFRIIKLRTMTNGRITFIGKVLRKTGWDELPQLINIVKGEMKFVGPRPLTQADIDRLEWNGNDASPRWTVSPGITGAAQLVNVCDKNVSLSNDLFYVENKSIRLDIKLLWRSLLVPFIGKSKTKQLIHKST